MNVRIGLIGSGTWVAMAASAVRVAEWSLNTDIMAGDGCHGNNIQMKAQRGSHVPDTI